MYYLLSHLLSARGISLESNCVSILFPLCIILVFLFWEKWSICNESGIIVERRSEGCNCLLKLLPNIKFEITSNIFLMANECALVDLSV